MPHLLIAGSTGTGKSVSVNAMLSSILFRATPEEVRLIMIDPKRLELGMYEEIPHLLTPVVVDPKLAANALRWAVREMEERYKTLAAVGVRNIEQYNRNIKTAMAESKGPLLDKNGLEVKTLPFIVVLIDELADLMMVASNEVEESICRLAQMARAVGIHLILATQRPSVDVITGLIKANLPARISFRVSSKIDSRTILDGNGAEQLLGRGDMLYLPPASSRFVRLHGPYISEQESARLASFLRKQGKPTYDETITEEEKKTERRPRVRQGRPLRRGRAHRRRQRAGVDFVSAAPAADRVQPRRTARGHDGGRGARVPRCWRQGARSAGEEGLLRRGRRAAQVIYDVQYSSNDRASWRFWLARRRCAYAQPPRDLYTQALAQDRAVRDARQPPTLRQIRRPSPPTSASSADIRRAATPITPCGRAESSRVWRGSGSATTPTSELACGSSSSCKPDTRRARSSRASNRRWRASNVVKAVPTSGTAPASAPPRHRRATRTGASASRPAVKAAEDPEPVPPGIVTVRGISRTPLPDGVRVSIEMDRELLFRQERLENPKRVFFDLRGAHMSPGLRDKTLSFPDDIVREIRVGRHPQNTTRVVMDTEGVESYSVFTLYNPYRVIVDFRRKGVGGRSAARARPAGLGGRPDDRLR